MQKTTILFKSVGFIATFVLLAMLFTQFKHFLPVKFERFAHGILGTISALITVFIFLKVEKKTLRNFKLNWEQTTLKKFAIGSLIGIGIAAVIMTFQIFVSDLEILINNDISIFMFCFWNLAFIPLAFMEEVAFRSYPLIKLNEAFGLRITQLILAVLFALYHVLMGWSVQSSFLGPGIWAFVFTIAAIKYNGISAATGLHFGLNLVQSILGGQKGIEPLYFISMPENASPLDIQKNENLGIFIHIALLLAFVLFTEYLIRWNKNQTSAGNFE